MGTRCYIAKDLGDGKYRTIFCMLDGYLEYTGALLAEHYATPERIDALLSLGDIYSLGAKLEPDPAYPHDWYNNNRQKDVTTVLGRDCGETDCSAQEMTLSEMEDSFEFIDFLYVFTHEHEWKYLCLTAPDARWRNVRDELMELEMSDQDDEEPMQTM
jgi:hypothetical protein